VVVTIIGILAMMAVPDMGQARMDRHTYDDAGQILGLVRTARTRAMGRGAAEMLVFDTVTATSLRGRYTLYEGVDPNPGGANDNTARVPRSSCTYPATGWTASDPHNTLVDAVDLDATYENENNITSRVIVFDNTGSPTVTTQVIALCFTPLGRAYFWSGGAGSTPQFTAAAPFLGTLAVDVARLLTGQNVISSTSTAGLTRRIIVPSSGNARIVSSITPPAP